MVRNGQERWVMVDDGESRNGSNGNETVTRTERNHNFYCTDSFLNLFFLKSSKKFPTKVHEDLQKE